MSELLARAERVVAQAISRGADEAEAFVETGRDISVEIEDGHIACASTSGQHGIGVRVIVDGRLGFASIAQLDHAERAIDAALRLAKSAPQLPFTLPNGGANHPVPNTWSDELAELSPETALSAAEEMLTAWREGDGKTAFPGGGVSLGIGERAIANSHGTAAWDRESSISASASLVDQDDGISVWHSDSSHFPDVDAAAILRKAERDLVRLRGAEPAPWSGACDVIFSPESAAELFGGFVVDAVRGDEAKRGNTVWSDAIGQEVANPMLSVRDDPTLPGAVGACSFDDEGLPVAPLSIVEDGVLQRFLYDSWDAAREGETTTHSAVRGGYGSRPTTGVHYLHFDVKGAVPEADLIGKIDRGYFIESVLGAHTANSTTGAFSITAPNVWRIEGGQIVGASKEIALGGTVGDLLKNLAGASSEERRMSGRRIPAMWFENVAISS